MAIWHSVREDSGRLAYAAIVLISEYTKYDVSTFSLYKYVLGNSGKKVTENSLFFEVTIEDTKIIADEKSVTE